MRNAFNKEVVRSITGSMGRFVAIVIISLLGAGFYAGLRMAAPDMRIAGDEFFDATNTFDVSVASTLGLDDASLATLRDVEGVGEVMGAYRADAMVEYASASYAASIESLPVAAASSDTSDGVHALSDDAAYLNRVILTEGSWPGSAGECVVGMGAQEKLGMAIGDEVVVEEAATDIDGTFSQTRFTVCGFVNSPLYISSAQMGVTSLGTGQVEMYLYAPSTAFDEDLPYSIAYLTVPAAFDAQWDSPAYDDAVRAVKERVEQVAGALAEQRWDAVAGKAQRELDDARADYEEERADAQGKLDDAASELADAERDLEDASAQLDDASAQLASAWQQLQEGQDELDEGEEEYASGLAALEAQRGEIASAIAQVPAMKGRRDELSAQLAEVRALDSSDLTPKQAAQTDAQIAQLAAAVEQLDARIAQVEQGAVALDQAQAALDAARAELDAGAEELERGRAEYYSGLDEYLSGREEYEQGLLDYEDGRREYEDNVAKANDKFADAEADLAEAQADIDDIEYPEIYVLDRTKNAGAASLSSDSDGITQIATFLPFMFFLVAALVALTSMTRMVDEERLEIGTHKALGYGRARITSKYLVYGALASGIGAVIGVVALGKLLPWFILTSYAVSYDVPVFPVPLDPLVTAKALALSVGVTIVATWGAAAASLRERPASLMLPRVPKAGKRIVLERIRPLWSRMSFSHKVTARNLLRYKRRFLMAVIGVAGCTALLMVGFGLRDAIGGIVSNQYEELISYDAAVRLDDGITDEERAEVEAAISGADVESHLAVCDFNLIAQGPADDARIEVVVPSSAGGLSDFVVLRDRVSGGALELGEGQVVLTEKVARMLGSEVGDRVELFDENDAGDKAGDPRTFTLGGVAENYLGHYAYLLPDVYRESFGEEPAFDLLYVKLAPDVDTAAFSSRLLSLDGVGTVSFVADRIGTYEDMLDVMNKLIYVIVALSAALAFVVLYNLTNINITERVREIATLKVLGFTKGEVNAYIFREIIVMALIGALAGCALGVPLTFYIAEAAETVNMMFGRTIEWPSYVCSFAITMAFSGIVAIAMHGKLARVNMVESLKSIE